MFRDSRELEHESDHRYADKLSRMNRPIKRPKASRRRGASSNSKIPGGIRQRRNKTWRW